MDKLSFLGRFRTKLTIENLYSKCDLILVPNKQLEDWLFVGSELNGEIQKRVDKNELESKTSHFKCIGLHRKRQNEFWMCDNYILTGWCLTSNGRKYELIFSEHLTHTGANGNFQDIKMDKKIYSNAVSLCGNDYNMTFIHVARAVSQLFSGFVCYYALNPFIIYEDLKTHGNASNVAVMTRKKREENVIPLTLNHHKYKIKNGVNVLNTETGRIFPSIAETSRKLEYPYGILWQLLKANTIPSLKRIEKLHLQS